LASRHVRTKSGSDRVRVASGRGRIVASENPLPAYDLNLLVLFPRNLLMLLMQKAS